MNTILTSSSEVRGDKDPPSKASKKIPAGFRGLIAIFGNNKHFSKLRTSGNFFI